MRIKVWDIVYKIRDYKIEKREVDLLKPIFNRFWKDEIKYWLKWSEFIMDRDNFYLSYNEAKEELILRIGKKEQYLKDRYEADIKKLHWHMKYLT